jgi:hypothetical protein
MAAGETRRERRVWERLLVIVVLGGATLGWLGAGRLGEGDAAARRAVSAAVALADQLQASVDALVISTAAGSEASNQIISVSTELRGVLAQLSMLDPTMREDNEASVTELAEAEASLLESAGGFNEANSTLLGMQTAAADLAASLRTVDVGDDRAATWQLRGFVVLLSVAVLLLTLRHHRA